MFDRIVSWPRGTVVTTILVYLCFGIEKSEFKYNILEISKTIIENSEFIYKFFNLKISIIKIVVIALIICEWDTLEITESIKTTCQDNENK